MDTELTQSISGLLSSSEEKRSEGELSFDMKEKTPNSPALMLADHDGRSSNTWCEMLHFLGECVTSNSNRLRELLFLIFESLAIDICQTLFPDIMKLNAIFVKTLNDDTLDLELRIAALSAAINFVQCLSSLDKIKRIQSLLPAMMRMLTDALRESAEVQRVLECYVKLAKNEPRFFRIDLVDVVNTMFEIAEDTVLEPKTRNLAVQFLLTLVEARKKAPGMMKKLPLFTHNYFALLLNYLLDINDEPSWNSVEDCLDRAGETDNYKFARECLTRFSKALGGKSVAHIAIEQLDDYLASPEWRKRHTALVALSFIAAGCYKVMIKYLEQVVSMVLDSLEDPHPRVRWAAIRSIAQLSRVFSPALQERYHDQVVPALAAAMDDVQNPRVQAVAAVAVLNFCGSEKPETLVPHLDGILDKLLLLIKNGNQMVQQEAIYALGGVADLSKEHFQKYYDIVMPYLRTFLVNTNDKSNHMLKSKALESTSMVGMIVGREKFRDDVNQVMEVLKSSQESHEKELGSIIHILKAWLSICRCMLKDFLPYMSTVMPLLVKCAQLEPDNIIDGLGNSAHKINFGDEMIYTSRNDFLEVKALVSVAIGSYALILEEDFYPWISQATSILVPLLRFYIHNDVRKHASSAMYILLISAKLAIEEGTAQGESQSYFKQLSSDIILALRDALYLEPDTKVCACILRALSGCLAICGPLLSENLLYSIIDVIKHVILESSHRKGELKEREQTEDFDAEEAELLREEIEQEDKVSKNVGNILVILIETFKTAFLPLLDELSSYLMPIKGGDKTAKERTMCIIIFNMLVRQCGEAALKYRKIYLPFLLESSNDENPKVREVALYGLGLCAENGVSIFKPFVGESIPRISEVITHIHAREPENECAYGNAVSALGKICHFHRESIDSKRIIPAWLNCLPVKGDMVEAKVVHDRLCSMVERSDEELLGPKHKHFPKIMSVFAEVLCAGTDLATNETTNRMINVLRNLKKTIPPAMWASTWSLLLPQQEMELEVVLLPEKDANYSSVQ